jgi:hypothetical protein
MIVSDNGPELISMAMLRWQQDTGIAWHYIQPGKPMQKALWNRSTAACATSCSTRPRSNR